MHSHHHHGHHGHNHHGHQHGKSELGGSTSRNIGIVFVINLLLAIIEFVGGLYTGSVAILSDALHDFGDSLSLGLAYFLEKKSNQDSNSTFSYGYRRYSLLSAVVTGLVLLVGSIFVLSEAIPRLLSPEMPDVQGMFYLSLLGMAVNGFMAWRIHSGNTMNERMISWHLIEDVLGWVLVFIVSLVMMFVDLPILDPILSIIFTVIILTGVTKTLIRTVRLFLQAAPEHIDLEALKTEIFKVAGVLDIHDLHFWSLDGESHVLTMHIVINQDQSMVDVQSIKGQIRVLTAALGKVHATIEIETELEHCPDVDCVKS